MTVRQPRYSEEEFAQRGTALYESQARSQLHSFTAENLSLSQLNQQ